MSSNMGHKKLQDLAGKGLKWKCCSLELLLVIYYHILKAVHFANSISSPHVSCLCIYASGGNLSQLNSLML